MENTFFFRFTHPIYYVLLLKSVIMLLLLPHVFILLFLYIRLFWSRLLFFFSWIINRAGFTSSRPMLSLLHFCFAPQFIRQQRSLITIASCFLEVLCHRAKLITGLFSIDTEITQRMNHPLVFMFIRTYFFSSDIVPLCLSCNTGRFKWYEIKFCCSGDLAKTRTKK